MPSGRGDMARLTALAAPSTTAMKSLPHVPALSHLPIGRWRVCASRAAPCGAMARGGRERLRGSWEGVLRPQVVTSL